MEKKSKYARSFRDLEVYKQSRELSGKILIGRMINSMIEKASLFCQNQTPNQQN